MGDKGFPSIVEEVNNTGSFLVMPPFKKGILQFTPEQNRTCYKIASVRIHVERAFGRTKTFKILQGLSVDLVPFADPIMQVICFFVNQFPDLIATK